MVESRQVGGCEWGLLACYNILENKERNYCFTYAVSCCQ